MIAEPLVENYDTHLHDMPLQTENIGKQNLLWQMLAYPSNGKI